MADILSQDEIDRLLNASVPEASAVIAELSPPQIEAVEKLTKVFFASANSTFSSLLAREVSVSNGLGQVVDLTELDSIKSLLVRFPFRSGFTGEMAFLIQHKESSMLADLILGGEGQSNDPLSESDLDAIKEATSQIAGSGAPTWSASLNKEIGFDEPKLIELNPNELSATLPWPHAFLAIGTIKVDGIVDTPFRVLLPVEIARKIAQIVLEEEEENIPPSAAEEKHPELISESISPPMTPTVFAAPEHQNPDIRNINLILGIEVDMMVRLGEAEMPLRNIQRLRPGSIIDLDKDTDAPVELVVNDKVIAKGELVVVSSDHFALRITEIESPSERIRGLGG